MNEENVNIDQHELAEDVSSKISLDFLDYFLVKPLEPVMVTKEFSKPIPKEGQTGEDGEIEYDDVERETKTVESDYRKAVVLKVPLTFRRDDNVNDQIKVGDVIVFPDRSGRNFDLLKNSKLVRYYDVIAIER